MNKDILELESDLKADIEKMQAVMNLKIITTEDLTDFKYNSFFKIDKQHSFFEETSLEIIKGHLEKQVIYINFIPN